MTEMTAIHSLNGLKSYPYAITYIHLMYVCNIMKKNIQMYSNVIQDRARHVEGQISPG